MTLSATNRVYSEIYKVIDSSDVIIYVLDARDPEQTRSNHVENYLRLPENEHRHLIYVLNKVDLVPLWATKSWINKLSQIHPTIAFNASARRPFGKAELISVLRQFSRIHKDRKNISVGFLGYPNVGKSSIINALIGKESCKVAPIPGETKVWQYVNLTSKIFLIDAPGVVFPGLKRENPLEEVHDYKNYLNIILQGVIRCEYIEYPEQLIPEIMANVKPEHIARTYLIKQSECEKPEELLETLARKWGRLLKGGEPDKRAVGRKILEDYVRGHLPHFKAPFDDEQIKTYKESIKAEREYWQHQTDSELIKFINKQKLGKVNQEFAYLNENLNAEQKALEHEATEGGESITESSDSSEDQKEEEKKEPKLDLSEEKLDMGQFLDQESSQSSVQGFESDDVDNAFDEEERQKEIKKEERKQQRANVPALVLKQKKRQKHLEGIQRATRIFQTKNNELLQAATCSLIDENLVKMVSHIKKTKVKKVRQGGFDHQKTGTHFYDIKRHERK